MVATVDQVSVCPNAHDVIPGAARLSLDLRHEDDSARERALLSLRAGAEAIAAGRGAAMRWHVHEERRAVPADPKLTALLARAVEEVGYPIERMPSGADHDAAAVAKIASIAMLFRALPGRHRPQLRPVDRTQRRRGGDRGDESLPRTPRGSPQALSPGTPDTSRADPRRLRTDKRSPASEGPRERRPRSCVGEQSLLGSETGRCLGVLPRPSTNVAKLPLGC